MARRFNNKAGRYSRAELTALVQMAAANRSTAEIAAAIHRSEASVRTKTSRINKAVGYRMRPRNVIKAELGTPTYNTLLMNAEADHLPVAHYVSKLLTIIAQDNLFTAIVDQDGAGSMRLVERVVMTAS
jgi:hypothetical protein